MRLLWVVAVLALAGCGGPRARACSPEADACLARCPEPQAREPGNVTDPAATRPAQSPCEALCQRYCH